MLDVVVAVNDEEVLGRNLLRSPLLRKDGITLHLQRGYGSASGAYNAAMGRCRSDIVVFAHQDVYIPAEWERKVLHNTGFLDEVDPGWAVLGVYGVGGSAQQIGHVWSSGLSRSFGTPFTYPTVVDSIDELLIILRRSSKIGFDEHLPGYHLYGTDLVQTAISRGNSAYVIWAPVIHNSLPSLYLGADYFRAYRYVATKWREKLPIQNCVAPIVGSKACYLRMRLRHKLLELRYRGVTRKGLDRKYDCVELAKRLGFEGVSDARRGVREIRPY